MKKYSKTKLFLIVIIASISLLFSAYFYFENEQKEIVKEKYGFLQAVTGVKLEQLVSWNKKRISDAKFFALIENVVKYTEQLIKNKDDKEAVSYFIKTQKRFIANGYDENIVITDTLGNMLFSGDISLKQFSSNQIGEIKNSLIRDTVIIGDFYFTENNKQLRLNVISVIKNSYGVSIGCFVQIADPGKTLIPIIQKFPYTNKSAETLIFRIKKDSITLLTNIGELTEVPFSPKNQVSQNDEIALHVISNKKGFFEGKDFQGNDVLADVQPIPGTDWFLVSKIDKNEILYSVFFRTNVFLVLLLIALFAVAALYLYKLQQSKMYKNLFIKHKELSETQEEYKTALYSIGDGVITTDISGKIKQMNPIAEILTGWKEDEAKGLPLYKVFNIINEETGNKVENPVDLVLKKGMIVGLANHTILISKSGKHISIADSGSPIKNNDNEIIGVVLVFRDQTEERAKEKLLLESEERFRKSFTTSPDAININRLSDGMYVSVNNGFLKLTGYTVEEVIGKTSYDINIWADIADREKLITGLKSTGVVENLEARFKLKNGEIKEGLMSAVIMELNNEKHIISITRDISERILAQKKIKTSEANLNSLINNRKESIWSIDTNYNYAILNNNFTEDYFETYKKEIYPGLNAIEVLSPELQAFWKPKFDAALSGERITFEFSAPKNDILRHYLVHLNPIISDEKITGVSGLTVDITEQKLAEKAFRENQLQLKSLINKLPLVLFSTDENGIFTVSEGKGLEALGLKPGQVVGMSVFEVYKDNPSICDAIRKCLQGEERKLIIVVGNLIYDVDHIPIIDETGKVSGLIGIAIDVTETKKVEKALIESEEQLRLSLKAAKQGLYDINLQTEKVIVNDEFAIIMGYKPNTFADTSPLFLQHLHPDDIEIISKAFQSYIQGKTSEFSVQFRHRTKDDRWKWILSTGRIIERDINGKPLRMGGTIMDITVIKLAEERFRSIWENSIDAMRLVDGDGIIINVNDSYCKLFGLKREELIGKPLNVSYIVRDSDTSLNSFKHRFNTRTIERKFETELLLKNKELIWVELSNSFIEFEDKNILLLSIFRDITDRKQLINQLIEAKTNAEEMNRLKAFFFANMSHELRTPFVGIMGFAEILSESLQNEDEKEMAEQILKSSRRLTDTLNKILNITRLEFDKIELHIEQFNAWELIKNIESLYSNTAKLKNTVLITQTEKQEILINSDQRILEEVLNNLVSNAVKFTENGIIKLSIGIYVTDDEQSAVIEVEDTGIGISQEKQNLVWQEFRQASEGLNRSFEGSGLGLSITKKYVEMLGGQIELKSEENIGSVFTITLPVNNAAAIKKDKQKIKIQNTIPVKQKTENNKCKILYVEDDSVALNYISIVLKSMYDVTTAFSATAALEKVNSEQYDFLMLDINLGKGMDGVELMQEIRKIESYKTTPIAAVTAYAAQSDKEEFLEKGFTHYISKPFTSVELKILLSEMCSLASNRE